MEKKLTFWKHLVNDVLDWIYVRGCECTMNISSTPPKLIIYLCQFCQKEGCRDRNAQPSHSRADLSYTLRLQGANVTGLTKCDSKSFMQALEKVSMSLLHLVKCPVEKVGE